MNRILSSVPEELGYYSVSEVDGLAHVEKHPVNRRVYASAESSIKISIGINFPSSLPDEVIEGFKHSFSQISDIQEISSLLVKLEDMVDIYENHRELIGETIVDEEEIIFVD